MLMAFSLNWLAMVLHPDDLQEVLQNCRVSIERQEPIEMSNTRLESQGAAIPARLSARPFTSKSNTGTIVNWIFYLEQQIVPICKLQSVVCKSKEASILASLNKAIREKTMLISEMSHGKCILPDDCRNQNSFGMCNWDEHLAGVLSS